jgi:hypothetical protein
MSWTIRSPLAPLKKGGKFIPISSMFAVDIFLLPPWQGGRGGQSVAHDKEIGITTAVCNSSEVHLDPPNLPYQGRNNITQTCKLL